MHAHIGIQVDEDDVLRITAANPGWRVERTSEGELEMTPPNGFKSSRRNARLTRLIDEWAEAHGYAALDSNGGFLLPDKSIVGPDASLVSLAELERFSDAALERFLPLLPVVAIEIASPSDRPQDLRDKLLRMRGFGTAYVVLIDPYRQSIWSDGDAPDGFDLDLRDLLR